MLHNAAKVPCAEYHRTQAKKSQQHFTPITAELPAPGHPFVFYKIKFEPFQAHHIGNMTKGVRRFNPYFQGLIENYN